MKKEIGPWACEWSYEQQCFNVDILQACIDRNNDVFALDVENGYKTDWILMGIFPSCKEANKAANELRILRGIPTIEFKFFKEHCE